MKAPTKRGKRPYRTLARRPGWPKPLSRAQRECMVVVCRHIQRHHVPPTLRELQTALRVSSMNAVSYLLRRLEQKGYIATPPATGRRGRSRAISVLFAVIEVPS